MGAMTHYLQTALGIDMTMMKPVILAWALVLNVFMISSCTSESFIYQFIVPEGASIDKNHVYVKADLGGLKNHKSMPAIYQLNRDGYTLGFQLDRKSRHPAIFISAKSKTGELLELRSGIKLGCGGYDEFKYENGKQIRYEKQLRYEWAPGFRCSGKGVVQDQIIMFKVLSQSQIIGDEKITFSLKDNGTYTEIDGI